MKLLFFALTLSSAYCLSAMDISEEEDPEKITLLEKNYFAWFEEQSKKIPSIFQALAAEDKTVFNQRLKYSEHPDEVIRSRTNYVRIFYAHIREAGNSAPCNEAALTTIVLKVTKQLHAPHNQKPTDLLSARTYVYSQLLTTQEKDTWLPFNYFSNPQAAEQVAARFSDLLVQELVTLGLVENTDEAKKQKAAEVCASKIDELKRAYAKTMPENKDQ